VGDNTAIEWTDATWNPWQGCTKVSPACKFCYMYRDKLRYGQDPATVIRSSRATFRKPLARTQDGAWRWPDGDLVFTCSWSDWFHEDADAWRDEAWEVIRQRPGLVFQILTKRPERIEAHLPADWNGGWPNVWLGVTVEDQQRAEERLPALWRVPAAVRFVSIEPLLGPVDLRTVKAPLDTYPLVVDYLHVEPDGTPGGLDWVITGGESGAHARPMAAAWLRSLRDQCISAGVPHLFKQWGEWAPGRRTEAEGRPGVQLAGEWLNRVGKHAAGRTLDGREHTEFPRGLVPHSRWSRT
jgi:protein gp37